jgi:hypothetical protein
LVAKTEGDDVLRPHQRTASLDVSQERRTLTGGEGKIHRRAFTIGLGFGLEVVGVAVDEEKAVLVRYPCLRVRR